MSRVFGGKRRCGRGAGLLVDRRRDTPAPVRVTRAEDGDRGKVSWDDGAATSGWALQRTCALRVTGRPAPERSRQIVTVAGAAERKPELIGGRSVSRLRGLTRQP